MILFSQKWTDVTKSWNSSSHIKGMIDFLDSKKNHLYVFLRFLIRNRSWRNYEDRVGVRHEKLPWRVLFSRGVLDVFYKQFKRSYYCTQSESWHHGPTYSFSTFLKHSVYFLSPLFLRIFYYGVTDEFSTKKSHPRQCKNW